MTFLEKAAQHVFSQYENPQQLEHVCVVVPTRRAVYFFKRALAMCSDRPFLSPEIIAIDDWVAQRCGLQIADSVSLLFELYDVYKEIDPNINFEKYLGWASILLQDFDRIDQYQVDPKFLFEYITEARALERWNVDWPQNNVQTTTPTVKKYFELFANLSEVYARFQRHLLAKSQAYRGMAYRHLSDNTFDLLLDNIPNEGVAPFHYFVGFNALSTSELNVVKTLIKAKRAACLWDTDFYYMRDNGRVEGGKLLRKYKEEGWAGQWNWTEDLLSKQARELHSYAVPNASMQAKVAGGLYANWLKDEKGGTDQRPTAIILADENLLVPMLYSLEDSVTDLNVTMGLSLRSSLLFTLIDSLFELQFTVGEFRTKDGRDVKIPKFNHRTVEKVLNHPFIRRYEYLALQQKAPQQATIIQHTIRHIQENNLVYLDPALLFDLGQQHPLFLTLFSRWGDNPTKVIASLYRLIDLLREVYKETQNALETEYLYLFYTLLKQLETTLAAEHVEKLNLRTFRAFLYELIRQTKIPFSGEPVSALQVLGMLETRTLDFDRIIILSMNEGVLPTAKRQNSLIPFDIAREVALPVYSDQDAVMSYHFYRLLQRASEVHLVYTSDPNTYNGGEPSRFLLQLEYELADDRYRKTTFQKHHIVFADSVNVDENNAKTDDWTIPKTDETLSYIIKQLTERGLYATHLSQYLKCSLQYYFARIAGVSEDEEVEDKMGANDFGSWVHATLEQLDIQFFMQDKNPTDAEIEQVLRTEFEKLFKSFDPDAGSNRLLYQVAKQITLDFLHQQMAQNNGLKVLATERKLESTLNIEVNNLPIAVKIAGKIDRIELLGRTVRVADYKTGKIDRLTTVKPEKIAEVLLESDMPDDEKKRQLWLYKYLVYKQMTTAGLDINGQHYDATGFEVTSGFYSLRNIKAGYIENPVKFEETEDAHRYVAASEVYLEQFLVEKLLNPDIPFQKTPQLQTCTYCDYRGICGR